MAAAAMALDELDRWLQARAERHPTATSLPLLDGYVAAIVAGPVSISPPDWICPLLAIDADAFNHGGTPEFAAISAVALRHNEISNIVDYPRPVQADASARSQWRYRCTALVPGFLRRDAAQVIGVGAVARRRQSPSRSVAAHPDALLRRPGRPLLGPQPPKDDEPGYLSNAHLGIPAAVEALRQYWMPIRYKRAR
jgi:uncharacterized protein